MKPYNKKKAEAFDSKKSVWGCLTIGLISVSIIIILIVAPEITSSELADVLIWMIIVNLPFLITYILVSKKEIKFNTSDKDIFRIVLEFLKYLKIPENERFSILKEQFSVHSEKELELLLRKYNKKDILVYRACKNLANQSPEIRYYVLYALLDVASKDRVFSIDEDHFTEDIRQWLKIHPNTFKYIKGSYLKQGIKEERKIIEEQNRKKLAESFLPYNAYKILGISPTVTKAQLKKVYRTLAKKYHPDKYYGQSDEIIQKAEDKFQEILEAYEIVLKYKKF